MVEEFSYNIYLSLDCVGTCHKNTFTEITYSKLAIIIILLGKTSLNLFFPSAPGGTSAIVTMFE